MGTAWTSGRHIYQLHIQDEERQVWQKNVDESLSVGIFLNIKPLIHYWWLISFWTVQNKCAYLVSNDKEQRVGRMNGSYSWHFLHFFHKRVVGKHYKGWSAQNNLKSKVLFVCQESKLQCPHKQRIWQKLHRILSHSYTIMKYTWYLSLKGQKSFTVSIQYREPTNVRLMIVLATD